MPAASLKSGRSTQVANEEYGIWYDGSTFIGDGKTSLQDYDNADDAAYAALGGKFRTPTMDEWKELFNTQLNMADYTWTWCDGSSKKYNDTDVKGWIIVQDLTSATIFLPVAGQRQWENFEKALFEGRARYYAFPIRPVYVE